MNEEEYLKASGWMKRQGGWDPPPRPTGGATCDVYSAPVSTAEAVEAQLAEDRARYNFMRERSVMGGGLLVPIPDKSDDCRTERKP